MTGKKKRSPEELQRDGTEADRQKDVHPWARAFGVSSDDLAGGGPEGEAVEGDRQEPDGMGAK